MTTTTSHLAQEFLRMVVAGHIRDAYAKFVAPDFRHHNPFFAGDATSLMHGMEADEREHPGKTLHIQRAIEDGDTVAVHSHHQRTPEDRGVSVVHIFRFEGGRIAELWDIAQAVPENSVNTNGMF